MTYLAYECYKNMAIHQMRKLCQEIVDKYPDIRAIACYHRVGEVKVGETSIVIVATSPHRKSAIEGVSECIDLVKMKVPIWKKEHYEDGT